MAGTLTRISDTTNEKWLKFNRDNETKETKKNNHQKKWTAAPLRNEENGCECVVWPIRISFFILVQLRCRWLQTMSWPYVCIRDDRSVYNFGGNSFSTLFDFNFSSQKKIDFAFAHIKSAATTVWGATTLNDVRLGENQLVVWKRLTLDNALKMRLIVSIAANRLRLTVSHTQPIDRWKKRNVFESEREKRLLEIKTLNETMYVLVLYCASTLHTDRSIHFYRRYFFREMALEMSSILFFVVATVIELNK